MATSVAVGGPAPTDPRRLADTTAFRPQSFPSTFFAPSAPTRAQLAAAAASGWAGGMEGGMHGVRVGPPEGYAAYRSGRGSNAASRMARPEEQATVRDWTQKRLQAILAGDYQSADYWDQQIQNRYGGPGKLGMTVPGLSAGADQWLTMPWGMFGMGAPTSAYNPMWMGV